jgi:uncharacterized membrane protein
MNERNNNKIEALLPPPEVLEKYKELGLGGGLIELVKEEQKHRHLLQNKYAVSYRIGQIVSLIIILYYLYGTFKLISNDMERQAYILTGMIGFVVLTAVVLVRRRRDIVTKKRVDRMSNNNMNSNNRYDNRSSSGYKR